MIHGTISDRQLARAALGPVDEAEAVAMRLATRIRHLDAGPTRRPGRPSALRLGVSAMAAGALVIAGNMAAIRLVPTYAQAISHAPLVSELPSPMLKLAGLSEAQVNRVAVSATSSGHTVTLVGASADSARTVMLVEVDGRAALPSKSAAGYQLDASLTDQYGHTYPEIGGQEGDLWFAPLAGKAQSGTAELTLHVRALDLWSARTTGDNAPPALQRVSGDWVVGTTTSLRRGVAVPIPASKTVGRVTYTVTSIRVSGTQVTIDWRVSGDPRIAGLYHNPTWGSVGDPTNPAFGSDSFLTAWIVDANGTVASVPGNSDSSGFGLKSDHVAEGTVAQVLPSHGNYILRIGQPEAVEFPFQVP